MVKASKKAPVMGAQRVNRPWHSVSVLRAGARPSKTAKVFYHTEKKTKG